MSWQELKDLIQSLDEQHKGRKKGEPFEELVAKLLGLLLEDRFETEKSGYQPRGDAINKERTIVLQTKNYNDKTPLDRKEILGDIEEAELELSNLQVYVLAASRTINNRLRSRFSDVQKNTGLDIVTLELTDKLSNLGALCVTFWENIHEFFDPSDTSQPFLDWVGIEKDKLETTKKISELRDKLKYGIQTQKHVQKDIEKYLLDRFSRKEGFNPINLSEAIDRGSLESKITDWWETERLPICYLEGKEGHGKTWLASKWMSLIRKKENIPTFWLASKDWNSRESIIDLLHTCFSLIYPLHEQQKITKLQNKTAKIWRKTLIVLDGVNERNAIEAAQRVLGEYLRHESEWKDRIYFLFTTRPLDDYPDFERYLWSEGHKISVDPFNDSELQEALIRQGLQLDDLPDSLIDIARIPRYFQTCIRLRNQFRSFDAVTKEMVLWADLLDKIERTDPQIKQKFGWHRAKDAQEILSDLAKQAKWTNVDAGPQASVQLLEKYFPDYREVRHDLEEQRIATEAGLLHVKLSEDHITLGWALYLANLFECREFTGIKDFAENFQNALEPIPSEDLRTKALFVALQITAISHNPEISQEQLSQKRAGLMLAWFHSHNAQITDEWLAFWAEEDPNAYAQIVEFEFEYHNSQNYEEALIEPLAKAWLNRQGDLNRLASRLTKWLLPTYADDTLEDQVYTHVTGQRSPREKNDIQSRLLDAALSILSQRPERQFLKSLARCYGILCDNSDIKGTRFFEEIGKLMRWGYTEDVLDELHSLVKQTQDDELLLRGVYGLAECLKKENLPQLLQRPLSEAEQKTYALIKEHNRRSKPPIERIRNQERLLIGDSPAANGNYHGLDYLAVRTDLPDWHHEDRVEIEKILQDVSVNAKLGWGVGATLEDFCIENLMPWVAKYDSKGYAELACSLKLNTLNQQWAQFKLSSIQGLIFEPEDCTKITEAILEMKQRLIQDVQEDNSSSDTIYLTSLLTETLLFSASEEALTDWFEFLASQELLRKSIFTPLQEILINELLPESIVKLAQQKLEPSQLLFVGNQSPSGIESEKITEEDFWCWIYLCVSNNDENTTTWAFENLKRRESDLRTMTFCFLDKARLDSNRFLSEIFTDKEVRKHLFLKEGRFFSTPIYEGDNSYSYENLMSILPQEVVGSFLCSSQRRSDLARWGKELMERMCSILQDDEINSNSVEELRFTVNREVLQAWATHNTTDFSQLSNKYFALLSKSGWYCRGLYDFMDNMLCLLLRLEPTTAMQYYRQSKAKGSRTIFWAYGGVETFLAQLWQVEECRLPEHHIIRRELLEECLNDEDIMFMTLAALMGKGEEELWNLATEKYLASPYAKERNLGISILPWFGTDEAIEKLDELKLNDSSQWVRDHTAWAYEVAQQERSCREVYREALQTKELFRISAVFEQINPALSPIARWWHREVEKKEFGEEPQDLDPKLVALIDRFWYRWGNTSQTKRNIEFFRRKLREYCRGEKLSAGSPPRIAPWWKPDSGSDSS